jgi:hypothetical protein
MTLTSLLKDGGRKYAVTIQVLRLGFYLSLTGLLAAIYKPEIAVHVAAILGSFGLLGSASIVSYQGAAAAKEWKHPDAPGPVPAPRMSGTVQVGDA